MKCVCCSYPLHQQMVQMCSFNQTPSLSSFNPEDATVDSITVLYYIQQKYIQQCHTRQMRCFIINDLLFVPDEKYTINACFSICFPCWLGHAVLHLHSTHSPQQSHPFTAWGLCLSVCCLQSIVSFQGRFSAMQKFANQLFWSSAYQTGLSSSSVRPVSLFVRFFCHNSSGWQKHCTSDPSSFSRLFFSITTNKTGCQSENLSAIIEYLIKSVYLVTFWVLVLYLFPFWETFPSLASYLKCYFLLHYINLMGETFELLL